VLKLGFKENGENSAHFFSVKQIVMRSFLAASTQI